MTSIIKRLTPDHASAYRALMLQAYRLHPDAFTSDVGEREALPIDWWEKRLNSGSDAADAVFAAFEGEDLLGVAGLSVERRKKASHKSTLFGMYVPLAYRGRGINPSASGRLRSMMGQLWSGQKRLFYSFNVEDHIPASMER